MSKFKSKLTRKLAMEGFKKHKFKEKIQKTASAATEAQRIESEGNRRRMEERKQAGLQ